MTAEEQRALLAVALLAAFADGDKSDAEREEIKRIVTTLGAKATGLNVPSLMQDVLLKRLGMAEAVGALQSRDQRQLAYELAVCVCDADGVQTPAERQFLASLKATLGGTLDTGFEAQADGLARETDAPAVSTPAAAAMPAGATVVIDRAALDKRIFNSAILCGALELLPQSWASMAIIPLQVKLVHGVAQAHGITSIDASMVKEFIATAGVGLTGQYLEQFGRKLVGGLLGKVMGGMGRGVGSVGTGMAMSFATTYALGQLAVRYYGGGRQMSTDLLKQTYQDLLAGARQMEQQALPQIQQQARTLDAGKVLELVRKPLA
ncbi:MAG: TerB family tellurite resistance protein [Burkholderiales bacterium]|nr:TerB family tellurite resistance protein [Burkholderiales bacterium]